MTIRYLGIALTLAGSLTVVGSARADIPPPPDYVEQCTVANWQTTTSECLTCRGSYSSTVRCGRLLSPYCYSKLCQTYGGSNFTELWCRTKGEGVPAVPSEILAALTASTYPLPDGGPATVPSGCLPYTPPDGGAPVATDAGGTGGHGGASAVAGAGGHGGASAAGGSGGQSVIVSAPPAGGTIAVGLSSATPGTSGAVDTGEPKKSSGCAVGGWLSANTLGPWLLAGLFGAIVMLARRRRR